MEEQDKKLISKEDIVNIILNCYNHHSDEQIDENTIKGILSSWVIKELFNGEDSFFRVIKEARRKQRRKET